MRSKLDAETRFLSSLIYASHWKDSIYDSPELYLHAAARGNMALVVPQ